jgi:tetratricopeptide (TPR) repeat protein
MLSLLILLCPLVAQDEKAIKDKQTEVLAFVKTAKSERDFRAATSDLAKLGEQAFAINKYELAAKIYSDAEKIARNNLKDAPLAQFLLEAGKKAADVGKEFAKAAKAVDRILRNEATPEDYTTSGRFMCFVKGDWEIGLGDLAKGKDETLKKLAEDDLAAANPMILADAWAAQLKKEPPAKERALYWYAKAWPTLTGVSREKVRERAKTLQRVGVAKHNPVPAPWRPAPIPEGQWLDSEFVHSGKCSLGHLSGLEMPGKSSGATSQPIIGKAGAKLRLRCWMMTDGTDGTDNLFLVCFDAAGKFFNQMGPKAPADFPFWVLIEQDITLPPNTASLMIWLQATGKLKGTIWMDDVSVQDENGLELVKNGGFEDK